MEAGTKENGASDHAKSKDSVRIEGNVVCASLIFVIAIVLDALTALPPIENITLDVPTSLRTSALVIISLIAAPPVSSQLLFEQRFGSFILLATTAYCGLHRGNVFGRIADAIFVFIGGSAIVGIHCGGHTRVIASRGCDPRGRRENGIALAAALLGYAGMRCIRSGFFHSSAVLEFKFKVGDIETVGFGVCEDIISTAQVFGGTIVVAGSVIILTSHDMIYEKGSTCFCEILSQLSALVFTSAFVIQVAHVSDFEKYPSLFGDSACTGNVEDCKFAFISRRFHFANNSPAVLWACAIGMVIFSFPFNIRCRSRNLFSLLNQFMLSRYPGKSEL